MDTLKNLKYMLAAGAAILAPAAVLAQGQNPPEIAGWSESTKAQQRSAGQQMVEKIESAARAGQKQIVIPKGHYRFKDVQGQRAAVATRSSTPPVSGSATCPSPSTSSCDHPSTGREIHPRATKRRRQRLEL